MEFFDQDYCSTPNTVDSRVERCTEIIEKIIAIHGQGCLSKTSLSLSSTRYLFVLGVQQQMKATHRLSQHSLEIETFFLHSLVSAHDLNFLGAA